MMYLCRLITFLSLLALSTNLAWGQSAERERCPASPRSSQQERSLTENRHYGVGYRVGSPMYVDPLQGWHVEKYRIAPGAPDGRWFNFSEIDGQLFTDLRQSNGRVAFDHEHKSSYTVPVEVWMQNSPRHLVVSNPNYCNDKTFNRGCGDCFFERVTVTVNIGDVPETPPQPKAPRVTGVHGSLTASWDLVEINPKISSHDVRYRISFKPFNNGPQGVIGTSATIKNLDYQKNYQVSIRATNSLGDSPWSATTPVMTTPPLPLPPLVPPLPPLVPTEPSKPEPDPKPYPLPDPDPPRNPDPKPDPRPRPRPEPEPKSEPRITRPLALMNLLADSGDGQVTLMWDEPTSSGSAITDYQYRINRKNPWISIGSTDTTHTVTGLVNGTSYVFQVRAVNRIGKGRASTWTKAMPIAPVVLDFAHFVNGMTWITDLVLVNVSPHPGRPAIYFYDTEGTLIAAESVVDITGDLEITEDGALTGQMKMEPLGLLTISTHGRGEIVSGSVKVVSDGPIGGMLRFVHPDLGVAGVGASQPVQDAIFPVRRQEGGITTGVAIHNLESSPGLVLCELMREGMMLDAAVIILEANGQKSWFIEDEFPNADTLDFTGSVRCDVVGEGMFSAVVLEMDPGNRIFTTLLVTEIPSQE